jgi:UPF0271 protein
MNSIDLNCDLGESFGVYHMHQEDALLDYVSSVNIACGFHAGDSRVMYDTVNKAQKKGVAIGAHPSLPDLQGFGRRELKIQPSEAYQLTLYQIGALYGFTKAAGARLHHVKPHGALYNMAARDRALAQAIVQAIYDFDASLYLYALAGSEMIHAAEQTGIKVVSEVFADRTYQSDGSLTPRSHENAIIKNELQAVNQVLHMVRQQNVLSIQQQNVPLKVETICIHGDNQDAIKLVQAIHYELVREKIDISAPQHPL